MDLGCRTPHVLTADDIEIRRSILVIISNGKIHPGVVSRQPCPCRSLQQKGLKSISSVKHLNLGFPRCCIGAPHGIKIQLTILVVVAEVPINRVVAGSQRQREDLVQQRSRKAIRPVEDVYLSFPRDTYPIVNDPCVRP